MYCAHKIVRIECMSCATGLRAMIRDLVSNKRHTVLIVWFIVQIMRVRGILHYFSGNRIFVILNENDLKSIADLRYLVPVESLLPLR